MLARALKHYLLALQFFTRVPVTGRLADWVGFSPAMLRASAGHFPGVGWLVGGLVAGLTALLLHGLPGNAFAPLVAAVWGTAFGVLITGAFHEDGLADVFDGLGGSPDRDRALIIMKDSRIGAFGSIAMVLTLLAKVSVLALLGAVNGALLCTALFAAHVVSRTWPLLLIRVTAFIWCFMALALVGFAQAATHFIVIDRSLSVLMTAMLVALLASGAVFLLMWRWFWQRLGGFTGDCLGTTQQLCELAFYLGLALCL